VPRLQNERQEIYAKMRAKGMIPSKAAIAAGYASGSAVYTELEGSPEVVVRIRELMDEIEEMKEAKLAASREAAKIVGQVTGYGKAWVMTKLAENASLAQQDGDYKEANAALKLIGEELGMFQGASNGEETDGAAPPTLDLDKLSALMGASASATVPAVENKSGADLDLAMSLIEGQGAAAKRVKRERESLNTDSETSVALTTPWDDDEPEEDEQ